MKKRKFDLLDFMSLIILIGIPLLCLYVFKLQLTTVFTIFALLLFLSILFDKKKKKGLGDFVAYFFSDSMDLISFNLECTRLEL
ncbi:hypothetical protein SLS72_10145 [Staphylococcus pseudintermedius]|nr:hypothetical protein [Staphylococcus pseudintermedius]